MRKIESKSILITGASTGIGRECALYLVEQGFIVFAGVRKKTDVDSLLQEGSDCLIPLILDVLKPETIKKALTVIEKKSSNFYGIINNAGISYAGPLEILPMEDFQETIEVNLLGMIHVIKTFLPLIRKNQGRIVNIGSVSGYLSSPSASAYCASKFAVEAVSEALQLELIPFNVQVSIVAPGAIYTPIWEKGKKIWDEKFKKANPELQDSYKTLINFSLRYMKSRQWTPVSKVAIAVGKALMDRKPKMRYIVGTDAKLMFLLSKFPMKWRIFILRKIIY